MTSDQITCLLSKLTSIKEAIEALPSYGSNPPAHPWETSTLNEGSREYDDVKDLMWTLVKNPVSAVSWFWELDLSVGNMDADGDGLADEAIDVYNTLAAVEFQIPAGDNIVSAIIAGFGNNNGVPTLCHRDGSTYYIWQIDDGSQASPIIQSSTICDRFEGNITGVPVTPGTANEVVSMWENRPTGDS